MTTITDHVHTFNGEGPHQTSSSSQAAVYLCTYSDKGLDHASASSFITSSLGKRTRAEPPPTGYDHRTGIVYKYTCVYVAGSMTLTSYQRAFAKASTCSDVMSEPRRAHARRYIAHAAHKPAVLCTGGAENFFHCDTCGCCYQQGLQVGIMDASCGTFVCTYPYGISWHDKLSVWCMLRTTPGLETEMNVHAPEHACADQDQHAPNQR